MSQLPDYYGVLGVTPSASEDVIKRAYREQVRKYHPDNFAADLAQARNAQDVVAIRRVEAKIERAKQRTQQINTAYRVLSNPLDRRQYDRLRNPKPEVTTVYASPPPRTTSKPRTTQGSYPSGSSQRTSSGPQAQARTQQRTQTTTARPGRATGANDEKMPWAFIGGLVVVLLLVFAALTSVLNTGQRDYVVARTDTPMGQLPVGSVDGTATAAANIPTATPLDTRTNLASANAFFNLGAWTQAAQLYTRVIDSGEASALVYFRRAESYRALGEVDAALSDYDAALALDDTLTAVYRGRGLAYFAHWRQFGDDASATNALENLKAYIAENASDAEVDTALGALPAA